ncbi:hypothetical protein [Glacieibacterium sp.]|uniref:hypothetical protein n=1 Tax=Glacieibacterium sp. TaxID=2860237 RepID=UPI003AFFCC17
MATKAEITPRDLPTKVIQLADGSVIRKKVVQADGPNFALELQAAFRSNVRRIRTEQRKRARTAPQPA